jgi:hypothetical protein
MSGWALLSTEKKSPALRRDLPALASFRSELPTAALALLIRVLALPAARILLLLSRLLAAALLLSGFLARVLILVGHLYPPD